MGKRNYPPFETWTIDLHERFPHWPYKKPKPGHEGFRLLDGPAPDFRRMTVEEFETLPAGLAVVKYDKKRSAFRAFPVDRPWYACQITYLDEIVGNIYDDPDLLKQGEDTQK